MREVLGEEEKGERRKEGGKWDQGGLREERGGERRRRKREGREGGKGHI